MCEPPMITRHTSKMFVMEGQEVSLRCKSIGDPEPSTHWVSPDGKLIGNTSRTICYENGSLDILKASVKVETWFISNKCWPRLKQIQFYNTVGDYKAAIELYMVICLIIFKIYNTTFNTDLKYCKHYYCLQ